MRCSRSSVCRTLTNAGGSSLNKHWFEFELTLYNILSAATWRRWHKTRSLIRAKPGHRIRLAFEKLKMTFSITPHRRTIFKDFENKCIFATKQHTSIHKDSLKYQLFGRHGRQYNAHGHRKWACGQTSRRQECQGWD